MAVLRSVDAEVTRLFGWRRLMPDGFVGCLRHISIRAFELSRPKPLRGVPGQHAPVPTRNVSAHMCILSNKGV